MPQSLIRHIGLIVPFSTVPVTGAEKQDPEVGNLFTKVSHLLRSLERDNFRLVV